MSKPNIFGAIGLTGGVVNRDLDSIDGNTEGMVDGAAAVVITDSGTYHYHLNGSSGAVENSPYVIKPDTNAGDKRWVLVAPAGPMSHVRANRSTAQSIADNGSTIIFSTEEYDDLAEYNTSTGIFTATYAGLYLVTSAAVLAATAWTAATGGVVVLRLYKNSSTLVALGYRTEVPDSGNSEYYGSTLSTVVKLAASDTLLIDLNQNSGGAINTLASAQGVYLTIDRIA